MTDNVAFVFPGQGSQEVGMGQALVENYPAARELFEQADDILGFSRVSFLSKRMISWAFR
jgi:[acyl-carrier-protein] S-malonyltransferase